MQCKYRQPEGIVLAGVGLGDADEMGVGVETIEVEKEYNENAHAPLFVSPDQEEYQHPLTRNSSLRSDT